MTRDTLKEIMALQEILQKPFEQAVREHSVLRTVVEGSRTLGRYYDAAKKAKEQEEQSVRSAAAGETAV